MTRAELESEVIELFRFMDHLDDAQATDFRARLARLIEHVRSLHDAGDELAAMFGYDQHSH